MPYIQLNLDSYDKAGLVASLTGSSENIILGGLMRAYRHCWRAKDARLSAETLRGYFGIDCSEALVEAGLASLAGDMLSLCDPEKFISDWMARSRAGQAAKGNLKRGTVLQPAGRSPGAHPVGSPPGHLPGHPGMSRSAPGTHPSGSPPGSPGVQSTVYKEEALRAEPAEQLELDGTRAYSSTPIRIDAQPERRQKPRAVPSRFTELRTGLCAVFERVKGSPYGFQGARDAEAIKRLMGFSGDDQEILRRWESALQATGWKNAVTIAQLASKWNEHAGSNPLLEEPKCLLV